MLLYAMGVMGFFMRRFDFPTAPVIIGMILGPLAEQELPAGDDHQSGQLVDLPARSHCR